MSANTLSTFIDSKLANSRPSALVYASVGTTLAALFAISILKDGDLSNRARRAIWRGIRVIADPLVIRGEISKAVKDIHFPTAGADERFFSALPEEGLSEAEVLSIAQTLAAKCDGKMDETLLSGVVYWGTKNNHNFIMKLIGQQLWSNSIFANYFGAVRKMEAEVSNMVLTLFNGNIATNASTYTMGGTESILLAMLAYRNDGRARGIENPEVVACQNVHPAFDKAAAYFDIRLIKVRVDPATGCIDLEEVTKNITSSTVAIVGSAPNYATGIIDPIEKLSGIALAHSVGLHVDACLGGFLLQFMEKAGLQQPVVDFRVPGVTSISCDIHKWGGTPKGASVVMFRSKELRRMHAFTCSDFPGGLYTTHGISGSRPGYVAAAAWGVLLHNGAKAYADRCRTLCIDGCQRFAAAVRATPELRLIGDPKLNVVAFTSDVLDIYEVLQDMQKKGFIFSALQFPAGIHLGLTLEHCDADVMDRLVAELRATCKDLIKKQGGPKKNVKHQAMVYGSTQAIPDRTIVDDVLREYTDRYYSNEPQ